MYNEGIKYMGISVVNPKSNAIDQDALDLPKFSLDELSIVRLKRLFMQDN